MHQHFHPFNQFHHCKDSGLEFVNVQFVDVYNVAVIDLGDIFKFIDDLVYQNSVNFRKKTQNEEKK